MTRHQDGPTSTEPTIDWSAVHDSEQFRDMVARRGRFVRIAAASIRTWFACSSS